jgi:hypothetical protein
MFTQVFESLQKATESSIQMQQEMFRRWMGLWPGMPAPVFPYAELQKYQKRWVEVVGELVKKQNETLEAQFKAGLQTIEEAFRLSEIKDPEVLRARTVELWQKTFDFIRQFSETQLRDFQTAIGKWAELMTRGAA